MKKNPTKQTLSTDNAPKPIGPYSQAVLANGLLFISGQISIDPKENRVELFGGDCAKQCERIMQNLENILQAAGLDWHDVVKTTVYLTQLENFPVVNHVYGKFFGNQPPARATVGVAKLPANAAIEIEAIAVTK